jgi:hypothetical protein
VLEVRKRPHGKYWPEKNINAKEYKKQSYKNLTEKELLRDCIHTARTLGYKIFHQYDSRRSSKHSYQTPGFPDLVLLRHPRLIFVELKRESKIPTKEQLEWLTTLPKCKVEAFYIVPSEFELFIKLIEEKE